MRQMRGHLLLLQRYIKEPHALLNHPLRQLLRYPHILQIQKPDLKQRMAQLLQELRFGPWIPRQ